MEHSKAHLHTHSHSHSHDKDCACDHDHGQSSLPFAQRWFLSVLIIGILLMLLKPFIVGQMLVRVTSYSTSSAYSDAVRICKKIIFIDGDNKQAWTSLGYAYMDLYQADRAVPAFMKVLSLDPDDKGAASFELGQAYFLKGDYTKAIGYFERIRSAGPRAAVILDADILKYRHGTLGFRSLNSMQTLLASLSECYRRTGATAKAEETQKEYDFYKNKHSKVLF